MGLNLTDKELVHYMDLDGTPEIRRLVEIAEEGMRLKHDLEVYFDRYEVSDICGEGPTITNLINRLEFTIDELTEENKELLEEVDELRCKGTEEFRDEYERKLNHLRYQRDSSLAEVSRLNREIDNLRSKLSLWSAMCQELPV